MDTRMVKVLLGVMLCAARVASAQDLPYGPISFGDGRIILATC